MVSALLRASLGTCFSLCRIASHWEADCVACHIDHVCSLHVLVRAALSKSMFLTGFVDQSCYIYIYIYIYQDTVLEARSQASFKWPCGGWHGLKIHELGMLPQTASGHNGSLSEAKGMHLIPNRERGHRHVS